jgi:hypothetical protein
MQPVRRAANSSFDAEDDLDSDLAEELSRFRSPDTWNKVAQHLDLVWKIGRVRLQRGTATNHLLCAASQGGGERTALHVELAQLTASHMLRGA